MKILPRMANHHSVFGRTLESIEDHAIRTATQACPALDRALIDFERARASASQELEPAVGPAPHFLAPALGRRRLHGQADSLRHPRRQFEAVFIEVALGKA